MEESLGWEKYDAEKLIQIVSGLSQKYTGGESTSVPYEMANSLMAHVIYCLEQSDNNGGEDTTAVSAGVEALQDAYERGNLIVKEKTRLALAQYASLKREYDAYGMFNLESEMEKTFKDFFAQYDPNFMAGDDPGEFLYPVLGNPESLHGIDAVLTRLNCIRAEQMFLKAIPREQVVRIIAETCQAEPGDPAYTDFYGSAAYEVLKRMVLCYLAWRPVETPLNVLEEALGIVMDDLDPENEIPDAVKIISNKYADPMVGEYLKLGVPQMVNKTQRAIEQRRLGIILYD